MVNLTSDYEQELPRQHFHYERLQGRIRETMPHIKITSIRQVHNKYLSLAFTVRENEMRRRNGVPSTITEYMHATGATKVASILRGNLDWRLVRRSKYGRGVSFSQNAFYANKYCNNRNGRFRAFVFCHVLLGQKNHVYDNNDTHPPTGIDSYQSSTGLVLVKFDDFTFNPKFVVYYEEGGYDIHSYPYNDTNFEQYDFDDSFVLDQIRNQEQRAFLQQILRIPLKNEDFLNAIVAENNKRTRTIEKPASSELLNQPPIMPKDAEQTEVDAKRPVTLNDSKRTEDMKIPLIPNDSEEIEVDAKRSLLLPTEDFTKIHQITFPGIHTPTTRRSTESNSVAVESDSRNGTYSLDRSAEPTTSSNREREIFCLITLVIITAIVCIGVIFYGLSLEKKKLNQ